MLPSKKVDKNAECLKNPDKKSTKNMVTLVHNWFSYIQLRYPETTCKTYQSAMMGFLCSLPLGSKPSNVTPLHLEQYVQQLISIGRTRKTANTYLIALKSFYKWAETYHEIQDHAKSIGLLKEGKKTIRVLSDTEYQAVLTTAPKGPKRDMFQFLANTGLRISEFFALTWDDFFLRDENYVSIFGKGGKSRCVPLNTVCMAIIEQSKSYRSRCQVAPRFVKCLNNQQAIYKLCAETSRKAKIAPFTPHALRHYFATRLIKAGVPLVMVSRILGHASAQFTEKVYVHLVPADYRGVTNVLGF